MKTEYKTSLAQREQSRRYRQKHPEKVRAANARLWGRNKDKYLAKQRAYYQENKEYIKDRTRWYQIEKEFGLSQQEYLALLAEQDSVCAMCDKPDPSNRHLAVDHDHTTGEVRGLLCFPCNTFLGRYEQLAEAATDYLKRKFQKG